MRSSAVREVEETGLATTDMVETPDRRAGSPADASEPPRRRKGRKELPEVPGPIRQRLLFNEAFVDRKRGDVLWLDKQGNVVGDSTSSVA